MSGGHEQAGEKLSKVRDIRCVVRGKAVIFDGVVGKASSRSDVCTEPEGSEGGSHVTLQVDAGLSRDTVPEVGAGWICLRNREAASLGSVPGQRERRSGEGAALCCWASWRHGGNLEHRVGRKTEPLGFRLLRPLV